jgi:hypothetical protein
VEKIAELENNIVKTVEDMEVNIIKLMGKKIENGGE